MQRFIPSEFGLDPTKTRISDLDNNFYARKAEIRHLVEAEGIPHTYICCNFFMSYLLPSLVQPGLKTPPRDKVMIFGDGNVKGLLLYIYIQFIFWWNKWSYNLLPTYITWTRVLLSGVGVCPIVQTS